MTNKFINFYCLDYNSKNNTVSSNIDEFDDYDKLDYNNNPTSDNYYNTNQASVMIFSLKN